MTDMSATTAERSDVFSARDVVEHTVAPPLAPHASAAIDRAHLSRMTGGDRSLEHEVIGLFVMQCDVLIARMCGARSEAVGALAHTLNGSARGVGAWAVAEAAETVERIAACEGDVAHAIERLSSVAAEARAAIGEIARLSTGFVTSR